jgi:predicted Fe-Mo cluster-binding NifX family protein
MKIAVPTQDGSSISRHFGRGKAFFVFEVAGTEVLGRSVRENSFTAHAKGECDGNHDHDHDHGHEDIVAALRDCEAVLCYGMGRRAADALKEGGIKAFVLREQMSPEAAVDHYINGKLTESAGFCNCRH